MAHEVFLEVPKINVGSTDARIVIKKNGSKIGELLISKGNIEWWPKGNFRKKKRLRWSEFEVIFNEYGTTIKS